MARVIISHLAPAKDSEIRFLLDLVEAFERRGHHAILWSAIYPRHEFAPYYLPLNWRLKLLPDYYADLTRGLEAGNSLIDRAKWAERVDQLAKQDWPQQDRTQLLDQLISMSCQVIEYLKPDLMLSWNTLCPHAGIAHDMCRALNIPAVLIERAVFPDTWFIEEGGLLGHSVLAGVPAREIIPEERREHYRQLGLQYLQSISFAAYNRYEQVQESPQMERLLQQPFADLRPRVSFFPPDDGSLGFVPPEHADRLRTLPGYTDSLDAAKALSRAHAGLSIFKPHPSFLERSYSMAGAPDLHIIDYDFRKVMEWSDIVATTGSGLEFVAMAMDKPVVLQANDILAGKGIAYEALHASQLAEALNAAQMREGFETRKEHFHEFCGYLVSEFVVCGSTSAGYCRKPDAAVEDLCARHLAGTPRSESSLAQFWEVRQDLLSQEWARKLPRDTEVVLAAKDKSRSEPKQNEEELLVGLRHGKWPHVVLDFDHTLYLENSTEQFLDAARPRTMAFLLAHLSDIFIQFAAGQGWCRAERWRDFSRVSFITVFMPWCWLWWRFTAAGRFRKRGNMPLIDAVAAGKPREVTIISFGVRHVIEPMLKALPFKVRLLSCELRPRPLNLRKCGKVAPLREYLPPGRIQEGVYVTDSPEDHEVVAYLPDSYLIQWEPYPPKAFHNLYLPMRYAVQGKYTRRKYFWNQILKEDFLLLLLAFSYTPLSVLALALLFLSFYSVYELGYWDNDHFASKREKKPSLSRESASFSGYPIRLRAWCWAAASGTLALGLVHYSGLDGEIWWRDALQWTAVLLGTFVVFRAFNSASTYRRVYVFPFLHALKNFAYAAILPVTALGALLLTAQVFCQTATYLIYRHGGQVPQFNRQTFRLLFFFVLLIPGSLLLGSIEFFLSPRFAIILIWMTMRIVERAYGRTLRYLLRDLVRQPQELGRFFARLR